MHGLLGEEGRDEGSRGGRETGESWTGKKQKCIAARWPSTERLSRLRTRIGEKPANQPLMVYVCQRTWPKLRAPLFIFRDHHFDENRRTGKFQADRFQNRCCRTLYTRDFIFLVRRTGGGREIRIFENRFIEKIRFCNWVIGR